MLENHQNGPIQKIILSLNAQKINLSFRKPLNFYNCLKTIKFIKFSFQTFENAESLLNETLYPERFLTHLHISLQTNEKQ